MNPVRHIVSIAALVLAASAAAPAGAQEAVRQVRPGGTVELSVNASDPDGDPLTFTWTATGGRIVGNGPRATFDATDAAPGRYTATVVVSDGKCEVSKDLTVEVSAPPPPPAIVRLGECSFVLRGARVTNACKQILDDAALRMQSDPTLQLVVDGHSAPGERAGVALRRAEGVRDYLVNERGVDARRIVVRSFDDRCPAGDAARETRVELYLLPEGRTASEIENGCR